MIQRVNLHNMLITIVVNRLMVKIDDKHVKQFQKYVKILLPNILLNDTILPVLEREKHNGYQLFFKI